MMLMYRRQIQHVLNWRERRSERIAQDMRRLIRMIDHPVPSRAALNLRPHEASMVYMRGIETIIRKYPGEQCFPGVRLP